MSKFGVSVVFFEHRFVVWQDRGWKACAVRCTRLREKAFKQTQRAAEIGHPALRWIPFDYQRALQALSTNDSSQGD